MVSGWWALVFNRLPFHLRPSLHGYGTAWNKPFLFLLFRILLNALCSSTSCIACSDLLCLSRGFMQGTTMKTRSRDLLFLFCLASFYTYAWPVFLLGSFNLSFFLFQIFLGFFLCTFISLSDRVLPPSSPFTFEKSFQTVGHTQEPPDQK